jgi:hypothetical protein
MSLVGGLLIHHDEHATIARSLESMAKIADPIIGLAVGEMTGAVEIASDMGVEIHQLSEPWTTHGPAAEELLRLTRDRGDYTLYGGAVETYELTGAMPELTAPVYLVPSLHEGVSHHSERIFKSGIEWTCPGPVHSAIQPPFWDERRELPNLLIVRHDDDGRRPEKLARYRDELEAWLQDHPHDHRSTYYLAQMYYHLGQTSAACGLYKRRCEMSNGDIEHWHSLYMAGVTEMQFNFENGAMMLLDAFRRRPDRMEPLWTLEQACHEIRGRYTPPTEGDILWMQPEAYLGGNS